jgi:tetratricopeptide (TPR) repeat protein
MQEVLREGYTRLAQGDHAGASACCRKILSAKSDLVEAHFLVGLVASDADNLPIAVQAFGSVTKLDPSHGAAWAQLARLFMRLGHVNRADEALARAVRYEDGNPAVQDAIATVYTLLGDQVEAGRWQTRALAQQPRRLGFLVNHANNQMFRGDFDGARDTLDTALDVSPGNANVHWLLSGLGRARDRRHVAQLDALLGEPGRPPRDIAYLGYALGKELEDLEDWPAAFRAFARGATARRQTLNYDESAEEALFAALEQTLTESWLASRAPGFDSAAPIFVVGQPRTGTTLVERIITAHSQVHSAGELRQFDGCLRRLLKWRGAARDGAGLIRQAAGMDLARLGEAYLSTTRAQRGDAPRFVDKLPANYRYLPLILAALPRAKVVHVRRGPMDACFASFKQLFADAYPHSYRLDEMARHHVRYFRLMQAWRERFGERFHEVDYERVASDPEPQARALIDFLELPWEAACLDFHRQSGAVTTASAIQVREAAHTRSVGRWQRYASELQPVADILQAAGVPLTLDT